MLISFSDSVATFVVGMGNLEAERARECPGDTRWNDAVDCSWLFPCWWERERVSDNWHGRDG